MPSESQGTKKKNNKKKIGQNLYYVFCLSWSETCKRKLAGIKKSFGKC